MEYIASRTLILGQHMLVTYAVTIKQLSVLESYVKALEGD